MYTSIRAELQKARRRHDLIVCLLVPVMALLWCQSAAPTGADELASAYSALFYSLPIINTILMPLSNTIKFIKRSVKTQAIYMINMHSYKLHGMIPFLTADMVSYPVTHISSYLRNR